MQPQESNDAQKIEELRAHVAEVRALMMKNVDYQLEHNDLIGDMVETMKRLAASAAEFGQTAGEVRRQQAHVRCCTATFAVVAAALTLVIGATTVLQLKGK